MNKKSLLGLILFACIVTAGLFVSAYLLTRQGLQVDAGQEQSYTKEENTGNDTKGVVTSEEASTVSLAEAEPWLSANPSDTGKDVITKNGPTPTAEPAKGTFSTSLETYEAPQLILDKSTVDYQSYIPDMVTDSFLETALDINNPSIAVDAEAAILFDADTKKVLFYKNPVQAMFPASTAKLLTSLVALEWCKEEEQVTIGDEITLIASDSTRAYLVQGEVLTIRNLLEAMLLPSGNDAAYAVAAFVGKKSLDNPKAPKEEAVGEFIRLMNEKAYRLGVKNSCFKTPDGYDAVGQYTTAYDMGLIGIAAADNATIIDVTHKSCGRNQFVSGQDVTWNNTNKLVTQYSGQYFSKAIGLKTGTSSMAGRCIIAAAEDDNKKVVCVVMDSTIEGRWEDAIAMLKYGLN